MSMLVPLPPIPLSDGQETLDLDEVVTVRIPYLPTETSPLTWSLVPFSGRKIACPKCGLGAGDTDTPVGAHYHQRAMPNSPCGEIIRWDMARFNQVGFPEHLDRACSTCQYSWVEALAEPKLEED